MTPAKHDKNRANAIDEVESGRALKLVCREMVEPPLIAISFSVAIVLVILFGVSGPRSTAATLNLLERIGYFGSIAALCWPFCHALAALVLYFVRLRPPLLMVPATVAAGLFAATNVATVAYALYRLFVPDHPGDLRWSVMYLVAAVVTIPYVALIYFLACQRARLRPVVERSGAADPIVPAPGSAPRSGAETGPPAAGDEEGGLPVHPVGGPVSPKGGAEVPQSSPTPKQGAELRARLLDRLPAELGRDIVYLKVKGHYVNVVTTVGSGARLIRFADAVADLGDAGMQVHRSYWVAHRHIIGVERREARTVLLLTGGEYVPVSLTYLAAVRAFISQHRSRSG